MMTSASGSLSNVGEIADQTSSGLSMKAPSSKTMHCADQPLRAAGFPEGRDMTLEPEANFI